MDPLPFRQVWLCDCEFCAPAGERPAVRCMVATEYHTRRTMRLWFDDEAPPPGPPFCLDGDALFIAFFASAEMTCFLALGWQLPAHVIDLYVEFKRHV